MNILVRRWRVPDENPEPPVPQEATFNTKQEFEALFDSPLVANRILTLFQDHSWNDEQFVVRIPEDVARRCGISTWNNHASLKIDPEKETDDAVYISEAYTERGTLVQPGAGKIEDINHPVPKTKIAFYEGNVPSTPRCWNCGGGLDSDRDARVYAVSRRHFSNDEYMPEQYPHPARAEYVCDGCTYGIVTTEDVDNFGSTCVICDRLKATCVERVVLPESTSPQQLDEKYDLNNHPSGVVCASCVDREEPEYLAHQLSD